MNTTLHDQLLDAHAREDFTALATLYGRAATEAEAADNIDAACFFLTQAYVFALEDGLPMAAEFNRQLAMYGRDVLQADLQLEPPSGN